MKLPPTKQQLNEMTFMWVTFTIRSKVKLVECRKVKWSIQHELGHTLEASMCFSKHAIIRKCYQAHCMTDYFVTNTRNLVAKLIYYVMQIVHLCSLLALTVGWSISCHAYRLFSCTSSSHFSWSRDVTPHWSDRSSTARNQSWSLMQCWHELSFKSKSCKVHMKRNSITRILRLWLFIGSPIKWFKM